MSSSPTARTSTTSSSPSSPSPEPAEAIGVVACGALALTIGRVAAASGLAVAVHPLPPLLHNRPERIAAAVEETLLRLRPRYPRLAVAYADCGTYGALDDVCARLGVPRLPGAHCYDVLAGPATVAALLAAEPGTYLLTDFLAASFRRTVVAELGLDRHPELREAYFRHYRRVVWLAERPTPELERAARDAADLLGLAFERLDVGTAGLTHGLTGLLAVNRPQAAPPATPAATPARPRRC